MTHPLHIAWDMVADTIWPRTCLVCESDMEVDEGNVCNQCWNSLTTAGEVPEISNVDHIWVGFRYDDRLRQIIHAFKFAETPILAESLGFFLVKRLQKMHFESRPGILVPVPDHPTRRRDRGFNPAAELATSLSRATGLPCMPELAKRLKKGVHQSVLSDEERRKALKDTFAFAVCEHPHRTVYIVDDVVHTGTTIKRLASEARKSGWKRIEAICLCR